MAVARTWDEKKQRNGEQDSRAEDGRDQYYNIKIVIFLDVTPCSLVETYQRLGGTCCLPFQDMRVRTVGKWGNRHRDVRKVNMACLLSPGKARDI
jgi:hypothetical protein